MRRTTNLLLLLFLLLPLSLWAQKAAKAFSIDLTVKDKETKEAIIMATVQLQPSGAVAVTNMDGEASIKNVEAGTYNYYSSPKVEYGYYLLPAEQANEETAEMVLSLDGVEDVNVNPKRKSVAITFFNDETTGEKLYAEILKMGIKAEVPAPHKCKEEK